jgi:hypothetical protein
MEDVIEELCHIDPMAGVSNTVFVTCTFDPKKYGMEGSWNVVTKLWSEAKRKLHYRFGDFNEILGVIEVQPSTGFATVHSILAFDRTFKVKAMPSRDRRHRGELILRVIDDPDTGENKELRKFKAAWTKGRVDIDDPEDMEAKSHGHVDIRVPASVNATRNHLLKYVQKGFFFDRSVDTESVRPEERKAIEKWQKFNDSLAKNVANLTLFNIRSFRMSRHVSSQLKEVRAARLNNGPCINGENPKSRFVPLKNLRTVGFAPLRRCLHYSKELITLGEARLQVFELQDTPSTRAALGLKGIETDEMDFERDLYLPSLQKDLRLFIEGTREYEGADELHAYAQWSTQEGGFVAWKSRMERSES